MTDVTRLIAPVDTTITARGDSDDTFSVHLATSSPTAACLDDDDCSAGKWRWLMIELPTGGGLQLGAKYAIAGGWFLGAAPLDEDKPSPPMTMQQDGYSMVLTLAIPAGTRLSLWRGADDDVVL